MTPTMLTAGVVFLIVALGGSFTTAAAIPLLDPIESDQSIEDNTIDRNTGMVYVDERKDWVTLTKPPPSLVHRMAGAITELECEASGSPPPTIRWLRDNIPMPENYEFENNEIPQAENEMAKVRSRIIINNIIPKEKTSYTCLAQAGMKTAFHTTTVYTSGGSLKPHNISEYIMLNKGLLDAPMKARITLYYSVLLEDMGSTLILPCKAIGNPRPEVYWVDNEEQIINKQDPRRKVLRNGELVIQDLRWSDMGGYSCVARNHLGKDTTTTSVYPMLVEN